MTFWRDPACRLNASVSDAERCSTLVDTTTRPGTSPHRHGERSVELGRSTDSGRSPQAESPRVIGCTVVACDGPVCMLESQNAFCRHD